MRRYTPVDLAARLQDAESATLLDVREPWEWEICRLAGSVHMPMMQVPRRCGELDPSREIVVLCHLGARSARVAAFLEARGFRRVADLAGGLDAWAREVDSNMATY